MYETDLKALEQKYSMHDFPLIVIIEPTNHCNFNCIMCSHDKMTRKKGIMDIRLYKKIIDEIAEVNPDTRIYLDFYGEPLTIKYKLYYMIDYAIKKGVSNVNLNTNGSLLDEEMAEMLLDSGLQYLSLDCDGFSKEVYEKIRRGGKRDKFFKNIEYLLERKKQRGDVLPIIDVKVIEMPENKHEVSQIMSYWQSKGAWTARRRMISWGGTNDKASFDLNADRIICGKALGTLAITWNGKVANCSIDADLSIIRGDVNVESIQDIWRRRNEQMVKYHFSHEWDKLPPICQQCNDWQIIGEERFDERGNPINKNYAAKGKTFSSKG